MSTSDKRRDVWGAQLHVRPLPGGDGGLGGAAGAYAWVYALACSEADYRELVAAEMATVGLFIADTESLGIFEPHPDDLEETRGCFERLSEQWPVQYHNFHSYPVDEA